MLFKFQHTHTHIHNRFMALWISSGKTRLAKRYQKKHSPTHTYCVINHQAYLLPPFIMIMASSLFNLHAWKSFSTISIQVFFGLVLAWYPPPHTPYISSPRHCLLFTAHTHTTADLSCCSTEIMSPIPSRSLNPLLGTLSCTVMPHIHLTSLITAHWSATSFFFHTGQVSLHAPFMTLWQFINNSTQDHLCSRIC